jgi:hypothetical protein
MSNPASTTTPLEAGLRLVERLRLPVVRRDGRDLRVACVHGCGSADNGHIDIDSGVYNCWSCGHGLNAFDLCKVFLRDHEEAKRAMIDVGLFTERPPSGDSPAAAPAGAVDIIDQVAQAKGTTGAGFRAYGAKVAKGRWVAFPTYRLDAGHAERCSYFAIDGHNPDSKGLNAKGKPAGVFLPGDAGPRPGETWVITEGAKNGPAYHTLGYKAVGLNGHHVKREFLPGFAAAFKGADVILAPDGDQDSIKAFLDIGRAVLAAGAVTVKLASLPYPEIKARGGDDVRDVLKARGPEAVLAALREAKPIEPAPVVSTLATYPPVAPGTLVRALDRDNYGEVLADQGDSCLVHFKSPEGNTADVALPKRQLCTQDGKPMVPPAEPPRFLSTLLTSQQLDELDSEPRYLVRNVVPAGQLGAAGAKQKGCKTSVVTDLVVSAGSATPFLGEFEVPKAVRCLFLCGESGTSKIRRQARQICENRGLALKDLPVWWGFDLPKLCLPDHVEALMGFIVENKIGLIPIDPLYLSLFTQQTAGHSGDLFAMGSVYEPLTKVCRDTGAAILLVHHFRKNRFSEDQEPCSLEELSQAGLGECARWWILLDRRQPYQGDGKHALWLRVGGSEGHASFHALDIDEGLIVDPEGNQRTTKWEVSLSRVHDAKAEEKRLRESRKATELEVKENEHRRRLHEALQRFPGGETAKALREVAGLNGKDFGKAITTLLKEGRAKGCEVTKGKRSFEGYQPCSAA